MFPTNTPRVFHVETTWNRSFPRRFNVEYTWSVCRVKTEQIEWWVQNRPITKNGALPVTTLFF